MGTAGGALNEVISLAAEVQRVLVSILVIERDKAALIGCEVNSRCFCRRRWKEGGFHTE